MTLLFESPYYLIILLGSYTTVMVLVFAGLFLNSVSLKRPLAAFISACLALSCFFIQNDICLYTTGHSSRFIYMPEVLAIVIMLLMLLTAIYLYIMLKKWTYTHVSTTSIKESLDLIPTGVCFYYKNGMIKLSNPTMEEICYKLTGKPLQNGNEFWDALSSNEDYPIISLNDDTVYSFLRYEHSIKNKPIYEITAANVSEQYRQNALLLDRQKRLFRQKELLTQLSDTIVSLTTQQEILDAKIFIHNEFGNALLLAKQYVNNPNASDFERLKETVNKCVSLLTIRKSPKQNDYQTVLSAAKDVGISVIIDGTLPDASDKMHLISIAIAECITNTFRHAKGDTLYITVKEDAYMTSIIFTNNGTPPSGEIKEGGGLINLRNTAKKQGVMMQVYGTPEFKLVLTY